MQFPDVPDGLVPALVTRVDRSAYDVLTPSGPARAPALPPPPDPRDAPTVGDWLAVSPVGLAVDHVLPRTSLLVRGTARGTSVGQPLAANVDHVLICLGLSGPLPVRRLERLLTLAWESGATPVVVLTKSDLCEDLDAAVREAAPHAPGCDVVTVSAATGDLAGLAPYAASTLVLLGASGAGKSTVVNALMGSAVMATSDIRGVDGKGRHTTSHRELLVLPTGGIIIDTPGLRGVALHAADEGLSLAFSDVEDLASACRFADCGHVSEPGCAVLASVAAGDLGQDRVDAWRKLQRELAFQARRTDARLRSEESRKWRAMSKAQRAHPGRP
ncbi:MAG TPA: ribosome small subunit-dependent GTPase A [Mycobacteriales bacterium]|nr:ribosome small subunit-dependent GTPase A [Mycobacteriales bacterium]